MRNKLKGGMSLLVHLHLTPNLNRNSADCILGDLVAIEG